jgi:predicted dehydrogenase
MILAKCCHDVDILRWLLGENCEEVSSFGDRSFFREENAPENSTQYCSDCHCVSCVYRAKKLYNDYTWMRGYFCCDIENDQLANEALVHSQYDRCVFKCDNDVVDHQVSIFRFNKNITAMHTMTAFSKEIYRDIKVHGTKAELFGIMEQNLLEIRPFGGKVKRIKIDTSKAVGGHGGGDAGIMEELYNEYNGLPTECITHIDVSIESHRMAFAAEKARETESVVVLK